MSDTADVAVLPIGKLSLPMNCALVVLQRYAIYVLGCMYMYRTRVSPGRHGYNEST